MNRYSMGYCWMVPMNFLMIRCWLRSFPTSCSRTNFPTKILKSWMSPKN
jgi:hypothetical protein